MPKSLKRWLVSRAYFDAQLSWYGSKPTQPVLGRRVSYWRWGSTLLRMRHWACCLAAPGWMGPHRLGTTQLIFWRRRISCCAGSVCVGAPSRLLGLRALVAELVWEANTGAGA